MLVYATLLQARNSLAILTVGTNASLALSPIVGGCLALHTTLSPVLSRTRFSMRLIETPEHENSEYPAQSPCHEIVSKPCLQSRFSTFSSNYSESPRIQRDALRRPLDPLDTFVHSLANLLNPVSHSFVLIFCQDCPADIMSAFFAIEQKEIIGNVSIVPRTNNRTQSATLSGQSNTAAAVIYAFESSFN